MRTKTKKGAVLTIPLTALRCLYRNKTKNRLVCELNVRDLKEMNTASTIEDLVTSATIEDTLGQARSFRTHGALMRYLNS